MRSTLRAIPVRGGPSGKRFLTPFPRPHLFRVLHNRVRPRYCAKQPRREVNRGRHATAMRTTPARRLSSQLQCDRISMWEQVADFHLHDGLDDFEVQLAAGIGTVRMHP